MMLQISIKNGYLFIIEQKRGSVRRKANRLFRVHYEITQLKIKNQRIIEEFESESHYPLLFLGMSAL